VYLPAVRLVVEQLAGAPKAGQRGQLSAVVVEALQAGATLGKARRQELHHPPQRAQDAEPQLRTARQGDTTAAREVAKLRQEAVQLLELLAQRGGRAQLAGDVLAKARVRELARGLRDEPVQLSAAELPVVPGHLHSQAARDELGQKHVVGEVAGRKARGRKLGSVERTDEAVADVAARKRKAERPLRTLHVEPSKRYLVQQIA